MKTPITQSKEWQKLQHDLKTTCFYEKTDNFIYLAIVKHTPVGNYLYLPYGPVTTTREGITAAIKSLQALAKQCKAIFIRLEPQDTHAAHFLPASAKKVKDISPADTWILDLSPEKSTLISNFSQGTRTRYNTYAKKGLTVEVTKDPSAVKYLVDLQGKLFKAKHLTAYDRDYLKAELSQPFASLYLVKYHSIDDQSQSQSKSPTPKDGQILAASLFFDYQDTRYYMQSAADMEYRKLPATVALLTTAIFDAKEQGIRFFDFWGIAPEGADNTHPWYGFTEFKKSFGGEERHYAGTYDLILNPIKYRAFTLLRKIRKISH